MTINIGLIGFGRIGEYHAEHSLRIPEANLVAIAEIGKRLDSAREFADRLGVTQVTQDHRELLSNSDIDAVVICTPTGTHAQIIVQAAQAGKHIFCEKPIALELPEVDEALAAVRQAEVKFQVGFNKRFDSSNIQAKRAILKGRVGTPHLIHIVSRHPAPPPLDYIKSSGGIFMDVAIHDFDMARWLMDSEVKELFADGGALVNPKMRKAGYIDTALIFLKFTNRALGTIETSLQSGYGYDDRVEVLGPGGRIATKLPAAYRTVISNGKGVHTQGPLNCSETEQTESYIAEMQAFVQAVANNTPTSVSGADGRAAIVIALAAQKSYLEGRWVKLEEII